MKKAYPFHGMAKFLILWSSQTISRLGSAMTNYALILWVYQQKGTATSITLLSFFTYLPSIMLCFVAGALADKWDKKKIMLISDIVAAGCTFTVLLLFNTGNLEIWCLYAINFLNSIMDAFQSPASYVATSLLVPKEQYARASGLQGFSSSLVGVLTPAMAAAVLAFSGLNMVLIIDLATFAIAFFTLLLYIRLPAIPKARTQEQMPFLRTCSEGLGFLWKRRPLMNLILYMAFVNLLAYMGCFGILPAMILSRTGNDQIAMGLVTSAIGFGTLAGSLIPTFIKPGKNKTRIVFITIGISFVLSDLLWGIGRTAAVWVFASVSGNLLIPLMNACLFTIMRANVPLAMQGRVLSARDTLQYGTIPIGLFLGGLLADHVFEPFMLSPSPFQSFLSILVGTGKGSGMAVIFLITGILGTAASLFSLRDRKYRDLDDETERALHDAAA